MTCDRTVGAETTGEIAMMIPGGKSRRVLLGIITPDDAAVTATLADGSTEDLTPTGGVVVALLNAARSVTVTTSQGGPQVYDIPVPPPVPAGEPAPSA